ncbi:MAG: hypothetical protein H0W50_00280 [Parachlamydiaceae bacterium]|nr:hypothetical protein [Parachlamydiaceae bacterium]
MHEFVNKHDDKVLGDSGSIQVQKLEPQNIAFHSNSVLNNPSYNVPDDFTKYDLEISEQKSKILKADNFLKIKNPSREQLFEFLDKPDKNLGHVNLETLTSLAVNKAERDKKICQQYIITIANTIDDLRKSKYFPELI